MIKIPKPDRAIAAFEAWLRANQPMLYSELLEGGLQVARATLRQEFGDHVGLFFSGAHSKEAADLFNAWLAQTHYSEQGSHRSYQPPEAYVELGPAPYVHLPASDVSSRTSRSRIEGWAVGFAYYPE